MPYTAGDPASPRAAVAGKDRLNRDLYVVGRELKYFQFSGYAEGELNAYYNILGGSDSSSFNVDMFMLISLH